MTPTIDSNIETVLRAELGEALQTQVSMAPFTTLKIGGPADFLVEAQTVNELVTAYRLALQHNLPIAFLGGCSNVLIDDDGLRGMVIINRTQSILWNDNFSVLVNGGYNLDRLVLEVSERGWADLSFAAGIPGSLGGALVGGAGAFGNLVHHYLIEATIMHKNGETETVPCKALGIEYRTSAAKRRGDIILTALLGGFEAGDREHLLSEIVRIKAEREVKHPGADRPSAGSFFKNLPPTEPGGRRTPAGKLLDEVSAKELRVGGAGVFEKHANIIVNHGGATAKDVDALANQMAALVKERFGIELEREVQYLRAVRQS